MTTKEEDVVSDVIVANTHDHILFFSSLGQVYLLKVYQLPLGSPQSKGRAMVNLFPLSDLEKISTVLVIDEKARNDDSNFLLFVTSCGNIRRNKISDFERIASNGKKAMRLDKDETLIGVKMARAEDDVLIVTYKGMANRFPVNGVRVFSGRDSNGVHGIKLASGDRVINVSILGSQSISAEEREAYYIASRAARGNGNPEAGDDVGTLIDGSRAAGIANAENEGGAGAGTGAGAGLVAGSGAGLRAGAGAGAGLRAGGDAGSGLEADSDMELDAIAESNEATEVLQLSKERMQELAASEQFILTITEKGFGKRTSAYAYRTTNRGTKGVSNIVVSSKNGNVVSSFPVCENDDIILVADTGRLMRCPVKDIRITNRMVQGVIVFRVDDGEKVVAVSCIPGEKDEPAL
jgi:DNA gyrase subunit A